MSDLPERLANIGRWLDDRGERDSAEWVHKGARAIANFEAAAENQGEKEFGRKAVSVLLREAAQRIVAGAEAIEALEAEVEQLRAQDPAYAITDAGREWLKNNKK